MKNMLLLLSLIAVPAWAEDAPVVLSAPTTTVMQAVPVAETSVVIQLNGTAKSIATVVADLEKDAAYKEAACSTRHAKKTGKTANITCAKANSGLMEFLLKNTPVKVRWNISAAAPRLTATCYKLVCGGIAGCFTRGCSSSCSPC